MPQPKSAPREANISPGALKLKEARQYLGGLSVPTMHRLIQRGLLRPNKSTRRLLFRSVNLIVFCARAWPNDNTIDPSRAADAADDPIHTATIMNHYFQFPLCVLSFLQEGQSGLNCIISFACVEVGKKCWEKFSANERQDRRSALPAPEVCLRRVDLENDDHQPDGRFTGAGNGMKRHAKFSVQRLLGIITKEFTQMRRDRLTFAMMLGIPLIQLTLFGYAINSDPRHLPAAVLLADQGPQGRTLLYAMKNSTFFDFVHQVKTETEGRKLLERGQVQFVVSIPENFSRDLLRGDRPKVLVEADATDPVATGTALGSLGALFEAALHNDLKGSLSPLAGTVAQSICGFTRSITRKSLPNTISCPA